MDFTNILNEHSDRDRLGETEPPTPWQSILIGNTTGSAARVPLEAPTLKSLKVTETEGAVKAGIKTASGPETAVEPKRNFEVWRLPNSWNLHVVCLALITLALVLWGLALPGIDTRQISDYGLILNLPPTFFAALVLLTFSFCLIVRQSEARSVKILLLLHLVALIFILHDTTALIYDTPRYSWTYKHIGVTSYIQSNGVVNPVIDIYHNWPGFFSLSAFFTQLADYQTALSFVAWSQVFFNLLYLGPLLVIFNTLSGTWRLRWLSAWFFYITSWPGQDYFSPQAIAYFLHLTFLAILLTYFQVKKLPSLETVKRYLPFKPVVAFYYRLTNTGRTRADETGQQNFRPFQWIGLKLILILLFGCIVAIHQLTPFITLASVTILVVFQGCRFRTLPIIMGAIMTGWVFYAAAPYINNNGVIFKHHFLSLFANLESNSVNISNATPGHAFISIIARGLTVSLVGLAILGGLRRVRKGYRDVRVALLAFAPIPMFFLQDYGGEMIYRVYLFALPWLAFFAASLFFPAPTSRVSWKTWLFSTLAGLVLLAGFVTVYYGNERMNNFSEAELNAARFLYQTAPAGSFLMKINQNIPNKFTADYNQFVEYGLMAEDNIQTYRDKPAPSVDQLIDLMRQKDYPAAYFVFSRSQDEYTALANLAPPEWTAQVEDAVRSSTQFSLIYNNSDVQIFKLLNSETSRPAIARKGVSNR